MKKVKTLIGKFSLTKGLLTLTHHDGSAVLCICIYMSCGYRKGNGRYGKDQSRGKYGQ